MSFNLLLFVFPLLMLFAAISDLLTMKVANWVPLALVAVYLVAAPWSGVPLSQIGLHLTCGFAVLAITFGMFAMGWMGGGDAKLASAAAVWLGWSHILPFVAMAAVLGGALTLFIIMFRFLPLPLFLVRQTWALRLHDRKSGIPYGIALGAAGLLFFPQVQIINGMAAV